MAEKTDKDSSPVGSCRNRIITFLGKNGKKAMRLDELETKCRSKKLGRKNFEQAFGELREEGVITVQKGMKVALCRDLGYMPGKISRLSRTFGFALADDGEEFFIPGKFMMGALPGDRVLIAETESRSGEPEGEIVDILRPSDTPLTGSVGEINGELFFSPDIAPRTHMRVDGGGEDFRDGDKVLAQLTFRGKHHAEHRVRITGVFGRADSAYACSKAILTAHGIDEEFSAQALAEAKKIAEGGVPEYSLSGRDDLRDMCVFTIDGADAKDLDDAVSLEKTQSGWRLGVHIADVSQYVKGNSALDKEAMSRGTSVYFADRVIPMLPKELSNGICSLDAGQTRLTISAFIELSRAGDILSYDFRKSIIKSRVRGVYSEVNDILEGRESHEIREKYRDVRETLALMEKLADILAKKKQKRHAPELETTESEMTVGGDGVCTGVMPRTRGKAEKMIEEFMLTANEAAAKFAREKGAPFVYRIHEKPEFAKTQGLYDVLDTLGVKYPKNENFTPEQACAILDGTRDTSYYDAVNILVLRAMAKAKYSDEPRGHFGLALEDYAHFTSPIRRYPDLAVHRIITDILAGYDRQWLEKRYGAFAANAAENSSAAEARAVAAERECEDCYKAEFMSAHIGESFGGKISGAVKSGLFVTLDNSAEGFVPISTLPEGEYDCTEPVMLTERFSGVSYRVGDEVSVICDGADISGGTVDLSLDDESARDA